MKDDLALILETAREAGDLARRLKGEGLKIWSKTGGSPVPCVYGQPLHFRPLTRAIINNHGAAVYDRFAFPGCHVFHSYSLNSSISFFPPSIALPSTATLATGPAFSSR